MGERTLGTSFQKSMVATARLAMPSGVNSNFCKDYQHIILKKGKNMKQIYSFIIFFFLTRTL